MSSSGSKRSKMSDEVEYGNIVLITKIKKEIVTSSSSDESSDEDSPGSLGDGLVSAVLRMKTEDLICPMCQDYPRKDVFQCPSGHVVCETCLPKLQYCLTCRDAYPVEKMRNRVAETCLDLLRFHCIYKRQGCLEKDIPRNRRDAHEIQCRFSSTSNGVKFCKLLHPSGPCEFRICADSMIQDPEHTKDVIAHLMTCSFGDPSKRERGLTFEKVEVGTNSLFRFALPISGNLPDFQPVKLYEVYSSQAGKTVGYFLLIQRISQSDTKNLSWAIVGISTIPDPTNLNGDESENAQSGSGKIAVKFLIKGRTSPKAIEKDGEACVSDLMWTVNSTSLEELKCIMYFPKAHRPPVSFSLPETFLSDHYKNADGTCEMMVNFGQVVG